MTVYLVTYRDSANFEIRAVFLHQADAAACASYLTREEAFTFGSFDVEMWEADDPFDAWQERYVREREAQLAAERREAMEQ